MRLLIVPSYYGYGRLDDLESKDSKHGVFFREQAKALAEYGHEVTLLFVHFDGTSHRSRLEVGQDGPLRTAYIHVKPWPRFNVLRKLLLMLQAVKALYVDCPPDIVHAHSYEATPYAKSLARALGVPYVVTEHSSNFARQELNWSRRLIARKGFDGAAQVIAVSRGLASQIAPLTKNVPIVVPNMVTQSFFETSTALIDRGSRIQFLSVGHAHPKKGWDLLLRAFSGAIIDGLDADLVLAGGGPETPDLMQLARDLHLGERVTFLGSLSRGGVKERMDLSDVFVLPSRVETFGIVVTEAMACGKPVIMTSTDAADELINRSNGITVPVEDVDAMRKALMYMAENLIEYDAVTIRDNVRRFYSQDAVCGQITEVYTSVVARRE